MQMQMQVNLAGRESPWGGEDICILVLGEAPATSMVELGPVLGTLLVQVCKTPCWQFRNGKGDRIC